MQDVATGLCESNLQFMFSAVKSGLSVFITIPQHRFSSLPMLPVNVMRLG